MGGEETGSLVAILVGLVDGGMVGETGCFMQHEWRLLNQLGKTFFRISRANARKRRAQIVLSSTVPPPPPKMEEAEW